MMLQGKAARSDPSFDTKERIGVSTGSRCAMVVGSTLRIAEVIQLLYMRATSQGGDRPML